MMKTLTSKFASTFAAGAMAVTGLAGVSVATAAPAAAMGCGYQVIGNDYWYNHCGTGNVQLKIDRTFSSEYVCYGPGVTPVTRGIDHPTNVFSVGTC